MPEIRCVPLQTRVMVDFATPYRSDRSTTRAPDARSETIRSICSSVSRALRCRAPRFQIFPMRDDRPLRTQSAMLSAWLPRNRWSGRTQDGLSHR